MRLPSAAIDDGVSCRHRRANRARLGALALLVTLAAGVGARADEALFAYPVMASADKHGDAAGAAAEPVSVVVSLTVNGQRMADDTVALRAQDGSWWLSAEALKSAHVDITRFDSREFFGRTYLSSATELLSDARFDETTQSLSLSFQPQAFVPGILRGQQATVAPQRPAGGFLNYDLILDHGTAGFGHTLYTEAGAAFGPGVLTSTQWLADLPARREALRLESTFTLDQPHSRHTLRAGDSVSRPNTMLGRAVRFGGLQFGTNFALQPGLPTLSLPVLSAEAALPSTVEVYVDNVFRSSSSVPPGPFSVTATPVVGGDGEVTLRVRDLNGREQVISQRFYASASLLAPGLSAWSLELGLLRRGFGLRSNDYGDTFAQASLRHGLTAGLTVEGGLSAVGSGLLNAQGGAALGVPGLGLLSFGLASSHDAQGNGAEFALGFERRSGRQVLSLRTQQASRGYRQPGIEPLWMTRRLDTAFVGYHLGSLGTLGLSWVRQQRMGDAPSEITGISWSRQHPDWGSLTLSLTRSNADGSMQASLLWSKALGRESGASLFHSQPQHGDSQTALQHYRNLPPGEGIGYRLQAGIRAPHQASLLAHNPHGLLRLEAAEYLGQVSTRASLSGGMALFDDAWFVTRRIDSSFGLLRMPSLRGVRVYVDNQLAARTDERGRAFLSRLHPYQRNQVSVEADDLPLDVQLDAERVHPVPAFRSGVLIDFPARRIAAATLDLRLPDGHPVPTGALATIAVANGERVEGDGFVVGDRGLLYLSGLQSWQQLRVTWEQGACSAELQYTPQPGQVPHLGEIICAPNSR